MFLPCVHTAQVGACKMLIPIHVGCIVDVFMYWFVVCVCIIYIAIYGFCYLYNPLYDIETWTLHVIYIILCMI